MTNSIFESLQIFFFFSLCENVSKVKLEYRFPLNQRMSKLDCYTCVLILCAEESVFNGFQFKRREITHSVKSEEVKVLSPGFLEIILKWSFVANSNLYYGKKSLKIFSPLV